MRIHSGIGTPIWISERSNGGLILAGGHNKLLLAREEIQLLADAIYSMTGVRAEPKDH